MYVRKKHNRSGPTSVVVMWYIPLIITPLHFAFNGNLRYWGPVGNALTGHPAISPGQSEAAPWVYRTRSIRPDRAKALKHKYMSNRLCDIFPWNKSDHFSPWHSSRRAWLCSFGLTKWLILTLLPLQGAVFLPNIHPGCRYALPWADRILGLQPVSPNLYPSINPVSANPPDFITFIRHHIAQWFWVTHWRSQETQKIVLFLLLDEINEVFCPRWS